jgi:hypothetical protein
MDPLIILSAHASVTSRSGLIATASTSFDHPLHLARCFASLDHITNGRAGWNIVTYSNTLEANNFGLDDMPDHAERYARASDVTEAAIALWNSRESDARIADKQSGRYFNPAKVQPINHDGPFVRSRGPLMGNTLSASNTLFRTHVPVRAETIRSIRDAGQKVATNYDEDNKNGSKVGTQVQQKLEQLQRPT